MYLIPDALYICQCIVHSLTHTLSLSLSLSLAPINDSSHPVSLQLVCNTRQGALEVFEILQHCPNILGQVLQESDKYILDLQMSRPVLQKIWTQLFASGITSKLQGLSAIELQGSFIIKLNQQQQHLLTEGNSESFCTCNVSFLCLCINLFIVISWDFSHIGFVIVPFDLSGIIGFTHSFIIAVVT